MSTNSTFTPFAHKYKSKIGRAFGKENMGEPVAVFKKEILKLARNEVHESAMHSDRALWTKIKWAYFHL